ncbi:MLO-like protein 13 [Selaginella moellendorffii]|uniref:MLO-like protein 13 n=1 Tax=Selaginella moellendorffii TaxID=88036 RepID=UPI000D1C5C43|nr:MLO-like protein 13 [Selaginella moellendorffii]|eukprot:XP_024525586.1 MLO-like protein 13 [Selaginella moellendorffii]
MAGEESHSSLQGGSLEITPTWAFALVCGAFILVSLLLERAIHYTGKWVRKRPEKSLDKALDKVKEELMLLGFLSLLLNVLQPSIAKICVPRSYINHFLPCKINATAVQLLGESPKSSPSPPHSRRLLFVNVDEHHPRRFLAGGGNTVSECFQKGKIPFISAESIHELHIFIFVLAIGHVAYSCFTLLLARLQVHAWNAWEKRAQALVCVDPPGVASNSGLKRQNTFLRKHTSSIWNTSSTLSWISCFFGQFGSGVTFTEYNTLRQGFIQNHRLANTFDFHKYVLRVLEDDFKKVVGISSLLWVFVVIFVLLNVNGWYTYFWIGFIPLVLLLVVGAKLKHVILTLAVEIAEEQSGVRCVVVNLRNNLFWFKKPQIMLYLLHFILFQNAFELAFFVWVWTSFGFGSCFRNKLSFVVARLVIGFLMLGLSSYRTLPLYALVTQMGDDFKFGEQIQSALTNLRAKVRATKKKGGGQSDASSNGHQHSPNSNNHQERSSNGHDQSSHQERSLQDSPNEIVHEP